jgi:hypothetical protein
MPSRKSLSLALVFVITLLASSFTYAGWVDISSSVEISKSRQVLDRVNRVYMSNVTIKNSSGAMIEGPVRLKIANSTIPVMNGDGVTEGDGQPFIELSGLDAEETKIIRINFQLMRAALTFEIKLEQSVIGIPVIQIEEVDASSMGSGLSGVAFTDTKNNLISIYTKQSINTSDHKIKEGISFTGMASGNTLLEYDEKPNVQSFDNVFDVVTNDFVEIPSASLGQSENIITVKTNTRTTAVLVAIPNQEQPNSPPHLEMIPFSISDGSVKFTLPAIESGSVYFQLLNNK